ncbi:dephospho-CoA kinase [Lutibacter sp.]|uniref:dephospho-CoA kinase n=1 Tax=Lutibacter sp. TaxID=1925666 RepID=UPI003569A83E
MVVGLTGGIGSGKTTVLNLFEALGAKVFIADVEAKKIMNSDQELKAQISKLFGKEAYINNVLNRKFIASEVFNNAEKLKALNALVHPKVRERFLEFKLKMAGKIIIYEAAILFESGGNFECDFVITVTADLNLRIERVMQRDGVTKEEIESRMQHQLNDDFKIKNSNFVIKNHQLKATETQVKTIFSILEKLC